MSLDLLPPWLREVADHFGLEVALRIAERIGGAAVRVPMKPTEEWELILGSRELAADFCATFGGEFKDVPRCAALLRHLRDEEIAAQHAHGETGSAIAMAHQMTRRNVLKILARHRAPDDNRQQDLFGES